MYDRTDFLFYVFRKCVAPVRTVDWAGEMCIRYRKKPLLDFYQICNATIVDKKNINLLQLNEYYRASLGNTRNSGIARPTEIIIRNCLDLDEVGE